MNKRILLSVILILVIIISIPFALAFFNSQQLIIYAVYTMLLFAYVLVYFFGGVVKFIIYTMYSLLIIILLYLLPEYHQSIIIIGGLMFVVNPLANLESYLDEKISDTQTLPIRISLPTKHRTFYEYISNMKNYVKLPQSRKLYTNRWYLRARQLLTLFLLFISVYLLINEMRNLVIDLTNYDATKLIIFYTVFVLFYVTFRLYKKGFMSFIRVTGFLMIFPLFFLVFVSQLPITIKLILLLIISVLGITFTIYEVIGSIRRVAYNSYQYYDSNLQMEVYANDFYEPLVYSEKYYLVSTFKFEIPLRDFQKRLNDVIVRANFLKTIITAYTYDGTYLYLHTDNYFKSSKTPLKFKSYLEFKFKTKVYQNSILDPQKEIYEKNFFHNDNYIVARAINLAELLKDFKIDAQIMVRVILNFPSLDNMTQMAKEFPMGRIKSMDSEQGFVGFVQETLINQNYLIETKVRDILLTRLIYQAQYVRILVFYLD